MPQSFSSSTEKIDVSYVAHLARLHLSEEEKRQLQPQLEQILGYVDQLNKLNVDQVEQTSHAIPLQNVLRDDASRPGLDHESAMKNAPQARDGQFVVPKIIE
jgi:aspartyl-tRNA(Asn)/glutamyl-tRNA(Gln) amidotransferase subunit C